MRYPNVMQRPVWITGAGAGAALGASAAFVCRLLASVQMALPVARKLKADGTKIAYLFLRAQLLLFSQNRFGNARSRHRVKVVSEVIGAVRGCGMKRRTARQLVRLLSDIRHAAHCSTLRAAATNREMALASAERHEASGESHESDDSTDTVREASANKPAGSRS